MPSPPKPAERLAAWKKRLAALRDPELGRLPGREAGLRLSGALDELLREIFNHCLDASPLPNPPRFALLALGALGRREQCVRSDVDLAFVSAEGLDAPERAFVEAYYRTLWDAGLELGAGVRSVGECLETLGSDIKSATSLMDARWLAGAEAPFAEFKARFWPELRGPRLEWFVKARLERRRERHANREPAERAREPNLKEGRGGLRDLHDALWIGRAAAGAGTLAELEAKGFLAEADRRFAEEASSFLLRVRNCLHLRRGRPWDDLTLEDRAALAPAMGYRAHSGLLMEEQFARDCFRRMRGLARIADGLVHRLQPRPAPPPKAEREPVAPGMFEARGRLRLEKEKLGEVLDGGTPLFDLFLATLESGAPLGEEEREAVRQRLREADMEASRRDPRCLAAFMRILGSRGRASAVVRAMHETGALAAYLPEFGKLYALPRSDGYHRYTVDEHTLRALEAAEAMLDPSDQSHAAGVARSIGRWDLLMLALLLHDIGKGEGRGHALRGAQIVRRFAARAGLPEKDADTVHFLVLQHLKMNHVAQRRDMADPRVMRDMASAAGTRERLDLLYVHTRADLEAVAPDVWNGWKEQLLRECHERTSLALEAGGEAQGERTAFEAPPEAVEAIRARLAADGFEGRAALLERLLERFPPAYFRFTPPEVVARHLEIIAEAREEEPLAWRLERQGRFGHTDLFLCAPDEPGLLRLVCRGLASRKIEILQARACATDDGVVADWLQIAWKGGPLPASMDLERLRARLNAVLRREASEDEALGPPPPLEPVDPEREAAAPTSVSVDNEASERFSVVEIKTPDRPGVLARACDLLAGQFNLFIHQALIATEAYRAVDVFYVTDLEGEKLSDPRRIKRLRQAGESLLREGRA